MKAAPARLLLVDDHPVVREGIAALLAGEPDLTIVGQAASGEAAIALSRQLRPDLVLMDLRMPGMDGADAVAAILAEAPAIVVVVLTTYDGDEDIHRALAAGARGYLLKDTAPDELLGTLRAVLAGRRVVPPRVATQLAQNLPRAKLSRRELDVLTRIASGKSNKEIAGELGIAESTVKSYVLSILGKLGAADRAAAAVTAVRRGILRLE